MSKRPVFLILLTGVIFALVVACGGGDDDSTSSGTGGGAGNTQPTAVSSNPTASVSTPAASSGANDNTSGATGSNDNFDLSNCPALIALANSVGLSGDFSSGDVNTADFDPAAFQKLADQSPNEIRADMQLISGALTNLYKLLDDLNVDISNPASFATLSPENLNKVEAAAGQLSTPELQAASDRVQAYFADKCK